MSPSAGLERLPELRLKMIFTKLPLETFPSNL